MSGQMTERYRLALIAHHASELARLMGKDVGEWRAVGLDYGVDPIALKDYADEINRHLDIII